MKSLYITSVENYSGKTATCLALGKQFKTDGYQVGYLKPLSLHPWRVKDKITDEDSAFVQEVLGLSELPHELSPVVVSKELLKAHLQGKLTIDLMEKVKTSSQKAGEGKDIVLLEGGGSLREGHAVNLPTPLVARLFSSHVLVIAKYHSEVGVLDDILSAKTRFEDLMIGAIINHVPDDAREFIEQLSIPYLEKRGVPIFGQIPHVSTLAAVTVRELMDHLDATVLTESASLDGLVENLTVGAMTAEVALHRFREYPNKAVITGGDRTDIQLAALETSTTCLILTGNLHPSPMVIRQAEEFKVAVLMVATNTMETIEAIDQVCGKSRLGLPSKLQKFEELFTQHIDIERLYQSLSFKT